MSYKKGSICECCGAKVVEYKHTLNAGLVSALYELSLYDKPMALTDINITRNQWTNFQKLRYWRLVAKELHADGTGTGNWYVTPHGMDFIANITPVHKNVWTFRGDAIRNDGELVRFSDLYDPRYKQRVEYAREAEAHAL